MTTTTPRPRDVSPQRPAGRPAAPAVSGVREVSGVPVRRAVDLMRFALGFVFLWAFLDKLLGLGYSTPGARSWLAGGSPTNGFLSHVEVGPFQSVFRSIAGNPLVDWLFMLGLLGVGLALILGVALRPAAVVGSVLMALMWIAEWPPARFTSAGDPTGSSNPLIDYHVVYAVGLIVVASLGIASTWGLGRWWSQRKLVAEHGFLR